MFLVTGKTEVSHKISINAVVTGRQPEYLPVIVAAVKAMTQPQFYLVEVESTGHPVTPLLIARYPVQ